MIHLNKEVKNYIKSFIFNFFRETWSSWVLVLIYISYPHWEKLLIWFVIVSCVICSSTILIFLTVIIFRCAVCKGSGELQGYSDLTNCEYNDHTCYGCNGWRITIPRKNEWYEIAVQTANGIRRHSINNEIIAQKFEKYKSEVIFSDNPSYNDIKQIYENQVAEFERQLDFENSQIEFYQVLQKKAHIILHKKQTIRKQSWWQKNLENISKKNIVDYGDTFADGEGIRLSSIFEEEVGDINSYIYPLLENEYTDKLVLDVRKATEKLKEDFGIKEPQILLPDLHQGADTR